jgi:alanine racemase
LSHTVAEISLPALRHNLLEVARRVSHSTILAVVKANAYGHGMVAVSRALLAAGVSRLGVASVEEGVELREAGITAPILVMAGTVPEELQALFDYRLTPVLPSVESVNATARLVPAGVGPLPVHAKVDTGMGRLGMSPQEIQSLFQEGWPSQLRFEGLMSHLAKADDEDEQATKEQLARFRKIQEQLKLLGVVVPIAHVAGSAGILRFPDSHLDMVRPGLMLYGYAPGPAPAKELRPALTWKAQVLQVKRVVPGQAVSYGGTFVASRPTTLAILGVGYADGYHRALSNRGRVLLHGQIAPVVGRVCMDLTVVDITAVKSVRPGDEAVLLGGNQGNEQITADDLATLLDTISYEVLTQIGRRVTRVYKEE